MSALDRPLVVALAGYALVATCFFAPLGGDLLVEQIGDGDNRESLWNAWWIGRSLLELRNPWWTDLVFAPEGTPLVFHSLAPVSSAIVALLSRWLPVHQAYNLVVVAALPVAGISAWALCRRVTADPAASFVGGLVFMLSPFITSKTMGHLDLLYGGLLPLFALCLLRALDAGLTSARREAWRLAGVSLLILFTCSPNIPIFAANFAFLLFVWQARGSGWRASFRRFAHALAPTLALASPYLLLVVVYAVAWEYAPRIHRDLAYDPEPVSWLLPLTRTSWWSETANALGAWGRHPGLAGVEPAVYLGVAVLPLGAAGLWLRRRDPGVAPWILVGAVFLVLSLGTKLQWQREVVDVGGIGVHLPFDLWRRVPVLGAVGQAARYAILVYLALAVGAGCAVAEARARWTGWLAAIVPVVVAALVCVDFAFRPFTSPLPAPLDLTEGDPDRIRVLDPRFGSAETMYQQTLHGRPIVGGYISRTPPRARERYERDPAVGWLFRREPGPPPSEERLRARLEELAVGDVLLSPDDPREAVLRAWGFRERDRNRYTTVWSR